MRMEEEYREENGRLGKGGKCAEYVALPSKIPGQKHDPFMCQQLVQSEKVHCSALRQSYSCVFTVLAV